MRRLIVICVTLAATVAVPGASLAQDQRNEQFYHPGSFNWRFLKNFPEAARLFNAFDYGHAVLYERLYSLGDSAEAARALAKEYQYLTTDLLVRPPRFAVAEEVIEPRYAKLAWKAKLMFDWAHVLHRQIYDVYADERLSAVEREALVERLTDYYLTRRDVAFTVAPKSMALMDEQYFSQVFRRRYPEFNGLIWAYHWLQVGLYEPLIAGETPDQQKAGVQAAVARFWEMLRDPPASMPRVMPMTATIAPRFTARHPRAAAIFDNLHIMHDIISDILAADTVPRDRKRHVIYEALEEFRDSTRNVMSRDEWLMMGDHMGGIMAMGGPPIGALPEQEAPPAPVGGHDAHAGHAMPGAAVAPVQTPDAVVLQFHQAVRRGDTTAALALLSPDVVIYEGGGVESSRDEFARGHLGADMAYAAATTREVTSTAAHVVGDVAWVINTTHVTGTFRGREVNSRGTETVVLRRIEGQWRIVHIHWSSRRVQP